MRVNPEELFDHHSHENALAICSGWQQDAFSEAEAGNVPKARICGLKPNSGGSGFSALFDHLREF
jgi:hypothetical protein